MMGIRAHFLRALALGVASALLSTSATAVEFRAGARASVDFQTRPFAFADALDESEKIEDTFSVRVGPVYELINRDGRLLYKVSSRTEYEAFLNETSELNAWEQFLRGEMSYAIGPSTIVRFEERFSYQASARFDEQSVEGSTGNVLDVNRDRFLRNNLDGTLSHQFTPRFSASLSGTWSLIDFRTRPDLRSDEYNLGTTLSGNYRLTRNDSVGVGYGFSYEDISRRSDARIHRAFAVWSHSFDESLSFTVQAGPAWIEQDSDVTNMTSNSTTVFGYAELNKSWRDFDGFVSYRRQESAATGDGSPTSFDQARVRVTWDVDGVWNLVTSGGWSRRESFTSGFAGAVSIDIQQWSALVSVRRRITNFSHATLQFRFFDQQNDVSTARIPNTQNFVVSIRIDYGLKPFHFDL